MQSSKHIYPLLMGFVLLLLAFPQVATGTTTSCIDGSPVVPVDDQLWGVLEPADKNGLPNERDSSDYTGQQLPSTISSGAAGGGGFPLFSSIDIENGYVFTGYTFGMMIWDARGANADDPQQLAIMEGGRGAFPSWPGFSEVREFVWGVDAPKGDDTIVALTAREPVGVAIIDTSVKSSPRVLYQDVSPYGLQVHAATIGGKRWAFVAADKNPASGLLLYDMSAAASFNGCVEASLVATECPGVFKGRIGPFATIGYVTGFRAPSGKYYIAATDTLEKQLYIYDVSNPLNPISLNTGGGAFGTADFPFGVALWEQDGKSFLGIQSHVGGAIYDLSSCFAAGKCSSLPNPAWQEDWVVSADRLLVSFSESDGTPFLYFGNSNKCSGGLQREWLYDVSGLTDGGGPVDITPDGTMAVRDPGSTVDVHVDYWSWYYARNPSGFSQVMPREGKFSGSHFYRVGWTLFDVHKRVNVSPSIEVTGPSSGFTGTAISFVAQARNCTPVTNGWTWTAGGGGTTASTSASANVTWTTAGTKTVSATNTGCPGATVEVASIQVESAAPSVGTITVSPSDPFVCQPVTFEASASGKPPLTYGWSVKDGTSTTVKSGAGNPFVWDTKGFDAGTYTADVVVSGDGSATKTSPPVTLKALPPLPAAGQFSPTNDAFSNASVQFHVDEPGATEWNWNFGAGYTGWSSDPTTGADPQHVYTQAEVDAVCNGTLPCTFAVTVKIRNCIPEGGERESAVLQVEISELTPLVASFTAKCPFGICSFPAGDAVPFQDASTGAQFWDYDWNGDGSFEDLGNTAPRASHTYATAGTYTPKLRVRRDGVTSPTVSAQTLVITAANPPAIAVTGPTSGQVGSALTFTASATNCSPASNGWSWTATGLSVSGSGASVTLTFPTAGFKQVTATNSACSGASGQRNVNITAPDDGGGGGGGGGDSGTFVPVITYTPQNPVAGQPVTFDGSQTQGDPATWFWSFGDNESAVTKVAQHTYQVPGSYTVSLTVSSSNCLSPNCQKTVHQTIEVGGEGGGGGDGGGGSSVNGCSGEAADDPTKLCLLDGRFLVSVKFDDPVLGTRDAESIPQSDKTGFFWFFRPDNVELILKVLDGGAVNGNWWVFYGGLSNVGYEITVTDTGVTPHRTKQYVNEPGTICGAPDQNAFSKVEETSQVAGSGVLTFPADESDAVSAPVGIGTGGQNLFLLDSRFRVWVEWRDQRTGTTGVGQAIPGTNRTGFFWFFNEANVELVVKMIDARQEFGHFWLLWGGLTDVEYTLRVEDTISGDVWSRTKPPGDFCGGADTAAF